MFHRLKLMMKLLNYVSNMFQELPQKFRSNQDLNGCKTTKKIGKKKNIYIFWKIQSKYFHVPSLSHAHHLMGKPIYQKLCTFEKKIYPPRGAVKFTRSQVVILIFSRTLSLLQPTNLFSSIFCTSVLNAQAA